MHPPLSRAHRDLYQLGFNNQARRSAVHPIFHTSGSPWQGALSQGPAAILSLSLGTKTPPLVFCLRALARRPAWGQTTSSWIPVRFARLHFEVIDCASCSGPQCYVFSDTFNPFLTPPLKEETPVQAIEDAFKRFTDRDDIAIVLINQYVSFVSVTSILL